MYGEVVIKVKELNEEESAVSIRTNLDNGSPEEVINIVHGLADSFQLLSDAQYAGVTAMCILTGKSAYQLQDELTGELLVALGEALHEVTNEAVDEFNERKKRKNNKRTLRSVFDKLFEN